MLALQTLAYLFNREVLIQLMCLHGKAAASPGQAGADIHILELFEPCIKANWSL